MDEMDGVSIETLWNQERETETKTWRGEEGFFVFVASPLVLSLHLIFLYHSNVIPIDFLSRHPFLCLTLGFDPWDEEKLSFTLHFNQRQEREWTKDSSCREDCFEGITDLRKKHEKQQEREKSQREPCQCQQWNWLILLWLIFNMKIQRSNGCKRITSKNELKRVNPKCSSKPIVRKKRDGEEKRSGNRFHLKE